MRFGQQADSRCPHTHTFPSLKPQSRVLVQNNCGPHPTKWDRSACVVEELPHDQYLVRLDGSGRVTRPNRQQLKHHHRIHPGPSGWAYQTTAACPCPGGPCGPPSVRLRRYARSRTCTQPPSQRPGRPIPRTVSCE